jgi:hypothetical protein
MLVYEKKRAAEACELYSCRVGPRYVTWGYRRRTEVKGPLRLRITSFGVGVARICHINSRPAAIQPTLL